MSAREDLFNLTADLSPKMENIIHRIMNLSNEQFEQLLILYSQQEKESCPACPVQRRTSA